MLIWGKLGVSALVVGRCWSLSPWLFGRPMCVEWNNGKYSQKKEVGWSLVCFTSLMASLIKSVNVGGLSKCFYQSFWLVDLNADMIGQSIKKRGVAYEFPRHVTVSSSFPVRFLYGFPYRFLRAWTVLWSMKHLLDVVRVGAWNSQDGALL